MTDVVRDWATKAEDDFRIIRRLCEGPSPSANGICFHAQQCAEKYLKARLNEAGIAFERTHKLVPLLDQSIPVEPLWEAYREDLYFLSNFAVTFRYPGDSATRGAAKDARARCQRFRLAARETLGLESQAKLRKQTHGKR